MIPTVSECLELMERYRMLSNIRVHSLVVARVAECLVRELSSLGRELSPELTVAGALLHDIAKTDCLGSTADHAREGRKICLRHQLHEIAEIVGEHIRLAAAVQPTGFSEKEIVYYADKRVNHDRIVGLAERLSYILEQYGQGNAERRQAIRANFEQCRLVESKLFAALGFSPAQLAARTRQSSSLFPELDEICDREAVACLG